MEWEEGRRWLIDAGGVYLYVCPTSRIAGLKGERELGDSSQLGGGRGVSSLIVWLSHNLTCTAFSPRLGVGGGIPMRC